MKFDFLLFFLTGEQLKTISRININSVKDISFFIKPSLNIKLHIKYLLKFPKKLL